MKEMTMLTNIPPEESIWTGDSQGVSVTMKSHDLRWNGLGEPVIQDSMGCEGNRKQRNHHRTNKTSLEKTVDLVEYTRPCNSSKQSNSGNN